ncbi:MAG: DUF3107 domain-containing protein [Actinobacteria bacterium]|nr:DUF3107 domain-containing protein [Actinomycetota bacterium]
MDVRIGVIHTGKEIDLELPEDADTDAIRADIEAALGAGGVLWITDRRGRRVGVPVDRLGYVEIDAPDHDRRIGFGA